MKKVLILAYDFPPYVSVGGLRPYSWYRFFKEFGIYPVVITRQWSNKYSSHLDYISASESSKTEIEETEFGTIIKAAYHPNISNRLMLKYGESKFKTLRKIITAFSEIGQFLFLIGPKSSLYYAANDYLKSNKIDIIIATAEPFILFKYASKLNAKFHIPWIADYRDTWSENKLRNKNGLLKNWNNFFEKKFLRNAIAVTTVSGFCKAHISSLLRNKDIYLIRNGYNPIVLDAIKDIEQQKNKLSIAFIGTIYKWHPLDNFLRTVSTFIEAKHEPKLVLKFYGTNYNEEIEALIIDAYPNLKKHVQLFARIPNTELIKQLATDNLMLLFNDYSIMGTKIYDYLAVKRRIILCYTDDTEANKLKKKYYPEEEFETESNQLQANLLREANAGIAVKDSKHLKEVIVQLYNEFLEKGFIKCDSVNIEQFSRKNQTKELTKILDKVIEQNNLIDDKTTTFRSEAFQLLNNIGYNNFVPKIKYASNRINVLCFHGVSPHKNFSYPPIHPKQFEKIIHYLYKNFQITTFEKISYINKTHRPMCVLTFDDGYKDFMEYALPVLAKYSLPAVQNIVVDSAETGKPFWTQRLNNITNFLHEKKSNFLYTYKGEPFLYTYNSFNSFYMKLFSFLLENHSDVKNYILTEIEDQFFDKSYYKIEMMSWTDIKQCADNNISIGSHSMTHDTLSTINNDELLINEIVGSKNFITSKIKRPVTSFAFPNGYYNEKVLEIAEKNYDYLLCTNEKTIKRSVFNDIPVIIPRISIDKQSFWENIAKINSFHNLIKYKI